MIRKIACGVGALGTSLFAATTAFAQDAVATAIAAADAVATAAAEPVAAVTEAEYEEVGEPKAPASGQGGIDTNTPDAPAAQNQKDEIIKLAQALEEAGIPILGTSPDAIDLAEDRERFAALVNKLGLKQPENGIARSREEAVAVAARIGYPVLTRPSYVLGGRAMEIVDDQAQLEHYIETAVQVSGDSPVLIDRYLRDAIEVDVDALCDGTDVVVAGVLQHIEEAGVHSGDSACSIPPYSLSPAIVAESSVVFWDPAAATSWAITDEVRATLTAYADEPVALRERPGR